MATAGRASTTTRGAAVDEDVPALGPCATPASPSFSLHRFQPVLNEFRPHYGVDYGRRWARGPGPRQRRGGLAPAGTAAAATWSGPARRRLPDGLPSTSRASPRASGPGPGSGRGTSIATTARTGLATGRTSTTGVKHGDQWVDPLGLKGIRAGAIPSYQLASFRNWQRPSRQPDERGVSPSLLKTDLPRRSSPPGPRARATSPADRGRRRRRRADAPDGHGAGWCRVDLAGGTFGHLAPRAVRIPAPAR